MRTNDPLGGVAVFLAVAEHLSFSAAAEVLGISRATVSSQVQELEKRLGVRLLQRSTRSVTLTEAGSAYRDALTGVLVQIREAERAATFFQTEAVGRLRIAAPPDLGQRHLMPIVAEFIKRYPGVHVEVSYSHSTVNLIEEGFDLAIRGTLTLEPNLITRSLGHSPIVVCASPEYLNLHGAPLHPEDLSHHACLHFAPLRWGRVWVMRREGREVHAPITPRLEVNDGESLRRAALEGAGITLLPTFIVGDDLRAGGLVQVLRDWAVAEIPVHAVYPANRHIAAKVRAFVDFVAARFRDHPDLQASGIQQSASDAVGSFHPAVR